VRLSILILSLLLVPVLARADALPDAPVAKLDAVRVDVVRRHTIDRRTFFIGVGLLAAAKSADILTTRSLIERGGVELNPLLGRHPSTSRQVGVNAAFFAAQTLTFYLTERSSRRWVRWTGRAWMAGAIADHAQLAACNSTIDPKGTERCTSKLPGGFW